MSEDLSQQTAVDILRLLAIAAPECTLQVPEYCGKPATSWMAIALAGSIEVRGRCEDHPAAAWIHLVERIMPAQMLAVIAPQR